MEKIFTFTLPKIIFGNNSLEKIGEEAGEWGKKALVVSGRKMAKETGLWERVRKSLNSSGVEAVLYNEAEPDPCLQTVDRGTEKAKRENCDLVISLGGGSALDVAKAVAIMLTHPGKIGDYQEGKPITHPGIPFLGIPTTAGTGSEITNNSVLSNKEKKIKKSVRSPYMVARLALVDPLLTLSMSPDLTAASGIDALSHAIESYLSLASQALSDALAVSAIKLVGENLPRAVTRGDNLEARENMALASLLAGMSFANSSTAGVHALASPLGVRHGVAHGVACALTLPGVMEFNSEVREEKVREIGKTLGGKEGPEAVAKLIKEVGLPQSLREVGISEEDIPPLTREGSRSGAVKFNPRPAGEEDLARILKKIL
jgi:1,3-propanediol dehydrogenase/alcohol dehydrogenase